MTNKDDNDIFIKHLRGVKPIKKSHKITKPIPKKKYVTEIAERKKSHKIVEKTKKFILTPELKIQKDNINKKLKKGQITINKKIDFHGCSLEEAKELFLNTITNCFIENYRCILFITGKGLSKKTTNIFQKNKLYYGKIRNEFLNWVSEKEIQSKILNVQRANRENGGDGAFFVYLRKNKN